MATKIGILGTGIVAQTLAGGFKKHGYDVVIGSRDKSKAAELAAKLGLEAADFAGAAQAGEIVVLAVKGSAAEAALQSAGPANCSGKLVIDASNPIAEAPPVNGVLQYFTGPNESLMEKLQAKAPSAHFVKAFSCVGNALMVNPSLPGGPPTMFICGNSAEAKTKTSEILRQFGWEIADMGGVEAARAIEPLAMLWCIPGFIQNSWMHAFKLLRS